MFHRAGYRRLYVPSGRLMAVLAGRLMAGRLMARLAAPPVGTSVATRIPAPRHAREFLRS